MTLRNSSGKFSLASFGRKTTNPTLDGPSSPAREQNSNGYFNGPESPSREGGGFFSGGGGGGGGGGGSGSGGVGKKLGKTIAHQSLLPGLGSKETRALQDVITAEKGVLQMTEKLSAETQKAAATLPPLGSQEGPDLQDILTHSSTLLNQLGTAMSVFVDHNANMRGCYKRIREREEELEDLRRRRRSTGQKAESAEKKLAKMGPENKGLPSQTELLERLRGEMRQMDTDIVTEDSKLGDFKRQQIKEALSYKFGGLEELGEKMCIIGELGKLLLEEIPLEETPPGYGRAPYTGYEKTENAVNEATKCLATVKFSAGSAQPRAPGLPPHNPAERLGTPQLPQIGMGHPNGQPQHHDIAAAEEYGNYPGGVASPEHPQAPFAQDQQRHSSNPSRQASYALDNTNPYGGIDRSHENHYDEYGGVRSSVAGGDAHVVWQGPTEEALSSHAQAQSQIGQTPHDYEYEQQRRMEEEAAWRATDNQPRPTTDEMPPLGAVRQSPQNDHEAGTSRGNPPWQPLNVRKDRSVSPEKRESAGSMAPTLDTPDLGERIASSTYGVPQGYNPPGQGPSQVDNEELALPPRINAFAAGSGSSGPPAAEGFSPVMERDGFYTPRESNTPEPGQFAGGPQSPSLGNSLNVGSQPPPVGSLRLPSPIPPPAAVTSPTASTYSSGPGIGGKISAAAFRKNKPRQSLEPEDDGRPSRRLPQPPGVTGQDTTSQITNDATAGPSHPTTTAAGMSTGLSQIDTSAEDGLYSEAKGEASPPPMYTHPDSLR